MIEKYWHQKTYVPTDMPCRYRLDKDTFYTGLTVCVVWRDDERSIGHVYGRPGEESCRQACVEAMTDHLPDSPQYVQNIPNTLYNLGAPWWLYYDEKPPRWPASEYILTGSEPDPTNRHNSGFKIERPF
jgi:hypothetical protein